MKVYLIRHGETAWSLSGQHTGVTDLGLTAHGEDESRTLAARLRALTFAQVLVSPRLRACAPGKPANSPACKHAA
jgi:broad specificity phosphatase PhoE